MSTHARKQIRDAIAQMVSNLPTTGDHVYPGRLYSLDDSELPSLSVFTIDEQTEEQVTRVTLGSPPKIHRDCPVIIEGHAKVDANIDDVLDQISLEVETAMAGVLQIGQRMLSTQLRTIGKSLLDDGEDQIGIVRLVYLIPYITAETTPHILE